MDEHHNPGARQPQITGVHAAMHSANADQFLVIPDTPDRLSKKPKNIGEGSLSTCAASGSRNSGLADIRTSSKKGQLFYDRGQNTERHSSHLGDIGIVEQNPDSFVGPSSASRNDIASTMVEDNTFKDASISRFNHHHKHGGKVPHSKFPGRPHYLNKSSGPVLIEQGKLAKFSNKTEREELGVQKVIRASQFDSVHTSNISLKSARKDCEEKAKIGHDKPINCDTQVMKGHYNMVSENHMVKSLPRPPQSIRSPSTTKRIRLVRNGCISPHNTAKAKLLAESHVNDYSDVKNTRSDGSHHVVDVDQVVSGKTVAIRAKGKGVMFNPCSPEVHEQRSADIGCLADKHGKRKCHDTDCRFGQGNINISNKTLMGNCSSSLEQVTSEGVFLTPSTSSKRQKKDDSNSGSSQKKPEVIFLSSCGESSTSKSAMDHGCRPPRGLVSPIVVGDLSPEVSESDFQCKAMELQVQTDEILARELQEQLYNEIPEAPSGERASPIWNLPGLADDMRHASRGSRHSNATRAVPASSTRRQSQSQSLRNRLFRRGGQARLPASNVARIRSHIHRHSLRLHGERNTLFPSDMDLDMRMGILEALEAAVNDETRMVTQLLDSDREFNENDYEMLLALDENNHQHLGASFAQITNLPESTMQNDTSEICSICLELPVIGDTIRHLPCLHKFHKDCIDPWLRRKKSCPVCKSDI